MPATKTRNLTHVHLPNGATMARIAVGNGRINEDDPLVCDWCCEELGRGYAYGDAARRLATVPAGDEYARQATIYCNLHCWDQAEGGWGI